MIEIYAKNIPPIELFITKTICKFMYQLVQEYIDCPNFEIIQLMKSSLHIIDLNK